MNDALGSGLSPRHPRRLVVSPPHSPTITLYHFHFSGFGNWSVWLIQLFSFASGKGFHFLVASKRFKMSLCRSVRPTILSKKFGRQYLGNEEGYQRLAGVKTIRFRRAIQVFKTNLFLDIKWHILKVKKYFDFWISLKLTTVFLTTCLRYFSQRVKRTILSQPEGLTARSQSPVGP